MLHLSKTSQHLKVVGIHLVLQLLPHGIHLLCEGGMVTFTWLIAGGGRAHGDVSSGLLHFVASADTAGTFGTKATSFSIPRKWLTMRLKPG